MSTRGKFFPTKQNKLLKKTTVSILRSTWKAKTVNITVLLDVQRP